MPPIAASPLRLLVVDDDPAARQRLLQLLRDEPDLEVIGECADGRAAIGAIQALRPDLVLLDVQMPGLDGFGVLQALPPAVLPQVIFTSAYADFAVRAFEAYALDYVLKPFDDARMRAAIGRARAAVAAQRGGGGADPRLPALLAQVAQPPAAPRYPQALAVKAGDQYVVVRVADIDWIEADGNHARLHMQQRHRLIAKSLAVLERELLDPECFLRVHRSSLVNVEKVVAVEPLFHGDVQLILRSGARVDCSRRYRARLQERLYFTT